MILRQAESQCPDRRFPKGTGHFKMLHKVLGFLFEAELLTRLERFEQVDVQV